jgi:hypothetical protein
MPKSGTHMFYLVLQDYYDGERYGKYHHIHLPPFDIGNYHVFTSCRNPYDRMVGAWWSTCIIQKRFSCGSIKFDEFVPWILEHRPYYPAVRVQSKHVKNFTFDSIIHLENLAEEFKQLPFYNGQPTAIPYVHSFTNKRKPWLEYYDKKLLRLVGNHYADDFKIYDYERLD